jgi:YVTN family beta-propeller protein
MRKLLMRILVLLAALLGLACGKKGEPERVYVSDEDSGVVVVIDTANDEVAARIPVGKRPRGIRVSPDGKRLFVALSGSPKSPPGTDESKLPPADRAADGIGVIDLSAMKLDRVIHAGQDPELFDVTSDGKRLWVSNEETAEASLVDVEAGKVLRRAAVGEEPEGVGIHPDGKHVYVTNERVSTISILDVESGADVAPQVPVCERPRSVVFSADGLRAFTACEESHNLSVIDTRTHKRTADLDLPGEGVRPMGLAISSDGRTLYASGGRGKTVHVVDIDKGGAQVKSTFTDVGERPWGIGLTRDGKKLYTANGRSGDVSVIDTATGKVLTRIEVGGSPWGIAVR